MSEMSKSKQIRKLQKICSSYNIPIDLLDWESLIDNKLTYSENETIILPLIENLANSKNFEEKIKADKKIKKGSIREEKKEIERVELNQLKEEAEVSEKEFEKSLNKVKFETTDELERAFEITKALITTLVKSNQIFGVILKGGAGLGKSYNTIKVFKDLDMKKGQDYDIMSSYTCYGDDIDVLTPKGVKKVKDLEKGELVWTINENTEELELKPVEFKIKKENYKELYHIKNQHIDLMVTKNHDMLFKRYNGGKKIEKLKAEELITKYKHFKIPLKAKWEGNKKEITLVEGYNNKDVLELAGWYIADGSLYKPKECVNPTRIIISKPKEKDRKQIKNLLDRMNIKAQFVYRKSRKCNGDIVFHNKKLALFLQQFGRGAINKQISQFILDLPKEDLQIIFNSMLKGDGHKTWGVYTNYITISPKLAKDMVELGFKLGIGIRYVLCKTKGKVMGKINGRKIISRHDTYRINIRYKRLSGLIHKQEHIKLIPNNLPVWCVRVKDNHNLIVGRNGMFCFCGNTPLELYQFLYDNKDNKVLVLDDTMGFFNNPINIGIVLSALWGEGKRIVHYHSSSGRLKVPQSFIFNSKVVWCVNELPKQLEAVKSRCFYHELKFSYKEKIKLFYEIAKLKKIPLEVVDFIKENTDELTSDMDFRLLLKVYDISLHNKNWKELCERLLGKSEKLILLKKYLEESLSIGEAQRKWCEATGHHRATFYRLKTNLVK